MAAPQISKQMVTLPAATGAPLSSARWWPHAPPRRRSCSSNDKGEVGGGAGGNPSLHCTAQHSTALYCTVLHCTALHCKSQYRTAHHSSTAQCSTAHRWSTHTTWLAVEPREMGMRASRKRASALFKPHSSSSSSRVTPRQETTPAKMRASGF